MSQNKDTQNNTTVAAEDQTLVEQLLGQVHTIAAALYAAADEQQAAAALDAIERIPEASQIALVKALAKVESSEAADVLSAVNTLGTQKARAKRRAARSSGSRPPKSTRGGQRPPRANRSYSYPRCKPRVSGAAMFRSHAKKGKYTLC